MTERAPTRPRPERRVGGYVAVVPVLLVVVLGVIGTLRVYLWRDEFATLLFTSLPTGDLLRATGNVDLVLAPYYLVIRGLTALGVTGSGTRIPSVVAAAVGVAVVSWLARRWWGPTAALVAALLLAVNPLYVQLSVDARPYALATALALLSTVLLVRALEPDGQRRRAHWIGYVVCLTLAGVLQVFAVLIVPAQAVLALRRRETRARFLAAVAVVAVLLAPLVIAAQSQRSQVTWIQTPDLERAAGTLFNVVSYQRDGEVSPLAVPAALCVLAAVVVVAGTLRRAASAPVVFAATLVLAPWALLLVASFVAFPVLTSHYLAVSSPGAALLFAAAVHGAGSRLAAVVAAVAAAVQFVVTLAGSVGIVGQRSWQDDFPALAAELARQARAGDVVLVVQKYEETGFAAGVAYYTGDRDHTADLRRRLPSGSRPVVDVRHVVSGSPLRTTATAADPRDGRSVFVVSVAGSRLPAEVATTVAALGCDLPTQQYRRDFGSDRLQRLGCG